MEQFAIKCFRGHSVDKFIISHKLVACVISIIIYCIYVPAVAYSHS